MKLSDLQNRLVVVFGAGRDGAATVEVITRVAPSARVAVVDDAPVEEWQEICRSFLASAHDALTQTNAQTVLVKSPGIPPSHDFVREMIARGATLTSSTNLFMAERRGRGLLIGITGTKGKSTTSALLAHVLEVAGREVKLVGNSGEPAIAHCDAQDGTTFVMELSSYILLDMETTPDIAVFLNVFSEHMDYHGSVEAYEAAKLRIAPPDRPPKLFVYHDGFLILKERAAQMPDAIAYNHVEHEALASLTLPGEHNRMNARAVVAVAKHLDVPDDMLRQAFATFKSLPHRLEFVAEVNGVRYINDSIYTTQESALAALRTFEGKSGAILLGGKDRGYDFEKLAAYLAAHPEMTPIVLPGGDRITKACVLVCVFVRRADSLQAAVAMCRAELVPGSVCLLSPASPSYGFFKNFEDRGKQFAQSVQSLL